MKLKINQYITHSDCDIESSLRAFSIRKHIPLDLKSTKKQYGLDNKYFMGYEKKNVVEFSRFRYSVETLFPKLIIEIDKHNVLKIRLSYTSAALAISLLSILLSNVLFSITSERIESSLSSIFIANLIFAVLTHLEFKNNIRKINQAISNFKNQTT